MDEAFVRAILNLAKQPKPTDPVHAEQHEAATWIAGEHTAMANWSTPKRLVHPIRLVKLVRRVLDYHDRYGSPPASQATDQV